MPFCEVKCAYCHFAIDPGRPDTRRQERYVAALLREIGERARVARHAAWWTRPDTLYLGGGTPSLLGLPLLAELLATVRRECRLRADAEICLEANPADLDEDALHQLRSLGWNRLSLGLQSFDDDVLRAMRRPHDARACVASVAMARRASFDNVSIDLVLGWPGETRVRWERTLGQALALEPEHLSLYVLEIEPKTLLRHDLARGRTVLPEEDVVADLYELSVARLGAAGLFRYEISNFARPGFESRHNLKYWTEVPFLGFGMAAHGYAAHTRCWNHASFARYVRGVEEAGASGARAGTRELSAREAAQEALFTGLRLSSGVSRDAFAARHGEQTLCGLERALDPAVAAGLVARGAGGLRLTQRGFLLSNEVFSALV